MYEIYIFLVNSLFGPYDIQNTLNFNFLNYFESLILRVFMLFSRSKQLLIKGKYIYIYI